MNTYYFYVLLQNKIIIQLFINNLISNFMKKKYRMKIMQLLFFLLLMTDCKSQQSLSANTYRITSSFTSFPDTARKNGYRYNNELFDAATHYNDSSVLVIVPDNFNPGKKVNIVCWFHGWNNTIDSASKRFELVKQFQESNVNAIFIFPEGATNAPDSYGGKLEQPTIFAKLVTDVLTLLKVHHQIYKKATPGNIVLAGHSGAYRVMASITVKGGLPVNEIFLFDGLYAETDKYNAWLQEDKTHRLINIYTNDGGTLEESISMIQQLKEKNISFFLTEEANVEPATLKNNAVIFIHSAKQHNDIINHPDNFKLFLKSSPFIK